MRLEPSDLLFSERLAPITTSMGFVEAELDSILDNFVDWRREIANTWDPKSNVDVVEVNGDLEETLRTILPFQRIHSNHFLFVPTMSNWVAYVGNAYRGTDPSAISYIARHIGCQTLWMVAKPHTLRRTGVPRIGRQGALIIELYGPEETEWLNHIRTIRLVNNAGRWEFRQSGDPFPFEDANQYEARKVSKRFSFESFAKILHHLGIHPFTPNFYLPKGSDTAYMVRVQWKKRRLIRDVSFKRARRLNHIDEGLRIFGRLISREGYF